MISGLEEVEDEKAEGHGEEEERPPLASSLGQHVGLDEVLVTLLNVEEACFSDGHEGLGFEFLLEHHVGHIGHQDMYLFDLLLGLLDVALLGLLLQHQQTSLLLELLVSVVTMPLLRHGCVILSLFVLFVNSHRTESPDTYSWIFFLRLRLNSSN
jgi:hypothetical protein